MNELTTKLEKLYAIQQELKTLEQRCHDLRIQSMKLENTAAHMMNDEVAYLIDGAIAICLDCEDQKIDFYPVVKGNSPLEDGLKFARDIVRIVAFNWCDNPVTVSCIIPGFSPDKTVDILYTDILDDLFQDSITIGDLLIAEVLQGVENASDLVVRNFQIAPADPAD